MLRCSRCDYAKTSTKSYFSFTKLLMVEFSSGLNLVKLAIVQTTVCLTLIKYHLIVHIIETLEGRHKICDVFSLQAWNELTLDLFIMAQESSNVLVVCIFIGSVIVYLVVSS